MGSNITRNIDAQPWSQGDGAKGLFCWGNVISHCVCGLTWSLLRKWRKPPPMFCGCYRCHQMCKRNRMQYLPWEKSVVTPLNKQCFGNDFSSTDYVAGLVLGTLHQLTPLWGGPGYYFHFTYEAIVGKWHRQVVSSYFASSIHLFNTDIDTFWVPLGNGQRRPNFCPYGCGACWVCLADTSSKMHERAPLAVGRTPRQTGTGNVWAEPQNR